MTALSLRTCRWGLNFQGTQLSTADVSRAPAGSGGRAGGRRIKGHIPWSAYAIISLLWYHCYYFRCFLSLFVITWLLLFIFFHYHLHSFMSAFTPCCWLPFLSISSPLSLCPHTKPTATRTPLHLPKQPVPHLSTPVHPSLLRPFSATHLRTHLPEPSSTYPSIHPLPARAHAPRLMHETRPLQRL